MPFLPNTQLPRIEIANSVRSTALPNCKLLNALPPRIEIANPERSTALPNFTTIKPIVIYSFAIPTCLKINFYFQINKLYSCGKYYSKVHLFNVTLCLFFKLLTRQPQFLKFNSTLQILILHYFTATYNFK